MKPGRGLVAAVAAFAGVVLIVIAAAMIYVPAAVGIAGVALLAGGLLVDTGTGGEE